MAKKKKKQEEMVDEAILDGGTPSEAEEQLEIDAESPEEEQESIDVGNALEDDNIPVEEKLELVKAAWDASELKAVEYLDGWQRTQAEFSNYRKRVNRDREQTNKDAVGRVVRRYLPILDDLERALKERPENEELSAWFNGFELIYRKMVTTLENDGVTPIEADGMFDPNLHEAVAQVPSPEHESGEIIDVIQTGYMIGERVLRPTRVAIAQ